MWSLSVISVASAFTVCSLLDDENLDERYCTLHHTFMFSRDRERGTTLSMANTLRTVKENWVQVLAVANSCTGTLALGASTLVIRACHWRISSPRWCFRRGRHAYPPCSNNGLSCQSMTCVVRLLVSSAMRPCKCRLPR